MKRGQPHGEDRKHRAGIKYGILCNKENCCGGGGRIWGETIKGERFSDLRLKQAVDFGAEVLATACPNCISNFEDSRVALEDETALEIKDITEIVCQAIQENEITE